MTVQPSVVRAFDRWYSSLKVYKASGGPAKGTISVALLLLERLKQNYDLRLESHRAAGKSQLKGAGASALNKILARFGETRPFLGEGGRTNRGGPGEGELLLKALKPLNLDLLTAADRSEALGHLQSLLVEKIRDLHNRQRIKVSFSPTKTMRQLISDLLQQCREIGKDGPVSQHLVGAKLEMRFPRVNIESRPSSAADASGKRPGDYTVGDTAFHVTMAPGPALYEKCRKNLIDGFRVYVLVPERRLSSARDLAEDYSPHQISAESIESFLSQNIEEMAEFSSAKLRASFRSLLETYNRRVDSSEVDKSLLFDLPKNL